MIKKIEYTNKEAIQNDSTIAEKNKVTDTDMNEIKDVVNSNADELSGNTETLSYTEIATKKNKNNIDILLENFDTEEAEGTKIDLENTAEAPIEVVEIAGNTIQNGEPSLQNEVEVVGVTGDVVSKFNNSNFLDESKLVEKTTLGITSKRENGKITLNGTGTVSQAFIVNQLPITLEKGTYYLNYFGKNKLPYFTLRNSEGNWIKDLISPDYPSNNNNIEVTEKTNYIIGIHASGTNTYTPEDTSFTLMVSKKNDEKYDYYRNQLQEISLGEKTLYGDENARDVFNVTIDSDFYQKTGYKKITSLDLVKNWKKEVLDGVDNKFTLIASSDYNNIFTLSQKTNLQVPLNNTTISNIKCNYLKATSYNDLNNNAKEGIAIKNDKLICLAFNLETITNLTSANAKLQELNTAGNPLYVVYQLSTPETENITDQTLISEIENFINNSYTYKQATSINSDFYLKLNYKKNMYYDLENRISALEQAQIL